MKRSVERIGIRRSSSDRDQTFLIDRAGDLIGVLCGDCPGQAQRALARRYAIKADWFGV